MRLLGRPGFFDVCTIAGCRASLLSLVRRIQSEQMRLRMATLPTRVGGLLRQSEHDIEGPRANNVDRMPGVEAA